MLAALLPFGISFAVTCTFFINLCAWIFQCGCHSLWAGADAACNVHAATGPHCPFCSHGTTGYAAVMILVSAPQLGASLWRPWSLRVRTLAALALFPIMMVGIGLVWGWVEGYW